jgi:hypothetical protein
MVAPYEKAWISEIYWAVLASARLRCNRGSGFGKVVALAQLVERQSGTESSTGGGGGGQGVHVTYRSYSAPVPV